ncbi:alpha-amylase family glycosyl hydrolase [Candidatus Nitrospira salsa]
MSRALHWWQEGVIYQVLVPSFLDSNGDGIGDLSGLSERLDYLQWLGARAIWLSPIYPSPFADLGYDVMDYCHIAPQYGSLNDFDKLLADVHRRDMKLILDWVPNHTSDEHPWFIDSRSNRESAKRDWYLWHDANADGSPPNNWISVFGGSVWQWDPNTDQYYLHTFHEKQPDLNWRNSDVQAAMFDTMRFWLNRGVDGFRIDALDLLLKDEQFRNNPSNPEYQEGQGPDTQLLPYYTRDQQGVHEIIATMRRVAEEFGDDRLLAGELYLSVEKVMAYYGGEAPELHLPLNMQFSWTPWNAEEIGSSLKTYLHHVPSNGWPSWLLSTHDCLRLAMRCPGDQMRVAAMLLFTLPGTPVHYFGEEIGMRGVPIPADQAIDPQGRRVGRNRDPERTPMQWNTEQHAGFSVHEPWLPIAEDFHTANVAVQSANPRSLLNLYRKLFTFQRETILGQLELVTIQGPLLVYRRMHEREDCLILLNFSNEPQCLDHDASFHASVRLSTFLDREDEHMQAFIHLRGNEGLIVFR